jgi:hypothetical protein
MNKKVIAGIILGLMLLGYGLGKWTIGRRRDRIAELIQKDETVNLEKPVAVATAKDSIPVLTQASTELPNPPFLLSWCEGKDCDRKYSRSLACDATLLEDAKLDSKKLAELKKDEVIATRIYYTLVTKLGSYVPLEAPKRVLVSRAGKNLWVSFHDHSWDSSEWPSDKFEKNPVYQVVYPETEAWALVKTKSGMSGFLKITEGKVGSCPFAKTKITAIETD